MGEINEVRAALEGAEPFMRLRSDLIDVLKDCLKWSYDDQQIEGHAETAEVIIAMFADRLATPEPEGGEEP